MSNALTSTPLPVVAQPQVIAQAIIGRYLPDDPIISAVIISVVVPMISVFLGYITSTLYSFSTWLWRVSHEWVWKRKHKEKYPYNVTISINREYTEFNNYRSEINTSIHPVDNAQMVEALLYFLRQHLSIDHLKGARYNYYTRCDFDYITDNENRFGVVEPLPLTMTKLDDHIWFKFEEINKIESRGGNGDTSQGDGPSLKHNIGAIYTLYSDHSVEFIKQFMLRIQSQFRKKIKDLKQARRDQSIYYYVKRPIVFDYSSNKISTGLTFNRYKLENKKSLDNLFIPDIGMIRRLIDNFKAKKGPYTKPNISHKLTFLLHGPPGCGKTSFIKALANYTHRHVISVPLQDLYNDSQLIDFFYSNRMQYVNRYRDTETISCENKEVIYVIEELDVIIDVLKKRPGADSDTTIKRITAPPTAPSTAPSTAPPTAPSTAPPTAPSTAPPAKDEEGAADKAGTGGGDIDEEEGHPSAPSSSPKTKEQAALEEYEGIDFTALDMITRQDIIKEARKKHGVAVSIALAKQMPVSNNNYCGLTLKGFLEVLDGIFDAPGRIMVFTTNHPEKLDPALVRSGRINKIINLTYMRQPDLIKMVENYYECKLSPAQIMRLPTKPVTPSTVEEYMIDNDKLDGFLAQLEKACGHTTS